MASNLATAPSTPAFRFIRYWLPVFFMIGAMYYASTDVFSGENTRSLLEKLIIWFADHVSARTIVRLNVWVRKAAHFTEYAVLALLFFRAFRADSIIKWRFRWALYTLGLCVGWALLDEFHQSFTRLRGASIYDSLLDSTGALFAMVVVAIYSLRRRRITQLEQ